MAETKSSIDIKHIVLKKLDDIRALSNMGEQNTHNNEIERTDLSVLFSQISDIAVGLDDYVGEIGVNISEHSVEESIANGFSVLAGKTDVIKH